MTKREAKRRAYELAGDWIDAVLCSGGLTDVGLTSAEVTKVEAALLEIRASLYERGDRMDDKPPR